MIDVRYVRRMARYNQWQNQNLYSVADRLSDAARRQERGAFFGSIHKTFNHLMWADQIWISRFTGGPRPAGGIPESLTLYADWDDLKPNRARFDTEIIRWADALAPTWLAGDTEIGRFAGHRMLAHATPRFGAGGPEGLDLTNCWAPLVSIAEVPGRV